MPQTQPALLSAIANQLRILSIQATTAAGSGHPTSCCSAADLVATLFFSQMRFDPEHPKAASNDRFVLSKGHAAPLLYAAWAETGHISTREIMSLRKIDSDFEGHPTPRLDFVDVATGSLGQGLSAGLGMAIQAKMDGLDFRTYVLMGDGEISEGSVWEAASLAGVRMLGNLVAIVDVNGLGQSQATAFGDHCETYRKRFEAFGWEAVIVDGHDLAAIQESLLRAESSKLPFAIIAKTIKGKGIPSIEGKLDWHGKALSEDQAKEAIAHLKLNSKAAIGMIAPRNPTAIQIQTPFSSTSTKKTETAALRYKKGDSASPRKAFGSALARMGAVLPSLVVLDGDVENSTYTAEFAKIFPNRFVECFISEQNMVGIAQGLSALGKTPVASTFAAFFARAYDQIRMAAISQSNIKLVGTHAGVSIGEDGASQMGLEDLACFRAIHRCVVLSPCDAVSTERCTELLCETPGMGYLRATRSDTPVLYDSNEKFEIGGAKILRQEAGDQITIIATGVTVVEALAAAAQLKQRGIGATVIDAYCIKPLARELVLGASLLTGGRVITVEDHYMEGGLGDAVAGELSEQGVQVTKLAVRELPHSGKKEELLAKYGIDAKAIVNSTLELLKGKSTQRRSGQAA